MSATKSIKKNSIGYEMFKRSFVAIAGEANDALYHVPLILAAGAASTAIACLGVCPAEVTRIRMVSNPSYAPSAMGVATRIVSLWVWMWMWMWMGM